jgi:UDPglucose 6-dehydrogenase
MVGTGYVGLVSGACFADTGTEVVCVDIDGAKIDRLNGGEIPIFEPGLDDMVTRNVGAKRLSFSADVAGAIAHADAVFIAVGTPRRSDGAADLRAVDRVAETVAEHAERELVLVLKSTVPVGTNARVRRITATARHRIHVVSNPEFLKEGDAIRDFMRPDRVIIGADEDDELARDVMSRLYHPVSLSGQRIIWMDPESAELTKYVANCMLAMRISFMNEIAALCERVKADVHLVRKGVGSDERIGPKFLYAGPGFGGSCLHGHETVMTRTGATIRLVHLEELFRQLAPRRASHADALHGRAIAPDDLQVLAWKEGSAQPAFYRCSAVTRRPFEGNLIALKTKLGRRLRCTPDHPLLVTDGRSESITVRLAETVGDADWLPLALGSESLGNAPATDAEHLDLIPLLPTMGITDREVKVRLDDADAASLRALGHDEISRRIAALAHPRGRERIYDILRRGVLRLDEAKAIGLVLAGATLGTARNGTYVPRRIPLSVDFWKVIGLYLAEGHCSADGARRRLCWSFHPTAEPRLVDEVAALWRSLGVKHDVRRTTTTMQVSVSSRILAGLFLAVLELGGDCYRHRLPDSIWQRGHDEQRALLAGLWQGDGSWSLVAGGPSVVLEYGTVSPRLAEGMLRLLAQHGVAARLKVARMRKSTVDASFLIISGADNVARMVDLVKAEDRAEMLESLAGQSKRIAPTGHRRLSDGVAVVRVVEARREPFQGFVYSLEVDEAHTIVTSGGLIVHNCFPKDVAAMVATARDHGVELELAAATERVNLRQKGLLARKLKHDHFGGDLRGKVIGVWGLAFKPMTDDIRDAPALQLIDTVLSEGATVRAHDPAALHNARSHYGDRVQFFDDAYEAADGADALVLVTEWREYQNPDFARLKSILRQPLLLDGRNIWSGYGLRRQGFVYDGVGVRGS